MTDSIPSTPTVPWTETLVRNKKLCGIVALVLGLLFAVLAFLFWRQYVLLPTKFKEPHPYRLALSLWATFTALMGLGGGGLLITVPDPPAERRDTLTRLCVLVATGGFGFITTFLGLALGFEWLESVEKWSRTNDAVEGQYVVGAMLVFFAGLAIMFAGLQAARSEERKSSTLRRILYGYNTVFTGLLLLISLTVVNVIVWANVPRALVTTDASLISLDENSRKLLQAIDQPVHVYLIMPEDLPIQVGGDRERPVMYTAIYTDCRALLRQCEDANPKFHSVYLSPTLNADQIRQLREKYKVEASQLGMLVVVGEETPIVRFIPYTALFIAPRQQLQDRESGLGFQAESALMTELADIIGGAKPIIYFTQSNGECQIQDMRGAKGGQPERKAERLAEFLRLSRFEVRPLNFEAGKTPNLDDATAVVIPGPTVPFRSDQVAILTDYLAPKDPKKKPGRLLAFLPPFPDAAGKVSSTGLEELLLRNGIMLNEDWLIAPNKDSQQGSDTILIRSRLTTDRLPLEMSNSRSVNPSDNRDVIPIFETIPGWNIIRETQLNISANKAWDNWIAAATAKPLDGKYLMEHTVVGLENLPDTAIVGVGVRSKAEADNSRLHLLMVVVGSDTLVNDAELDKKPHVDRYLTTARGALDVLREKQSFAVPPRKLPVYELRKDVSQTAVVWMPIGLILLTILGLGVGVWMVRRGG